MQLELLEDVSKIACLIGGFLTGATFGVVLSISIKKVSVVMGNRKIDQRHAHAGGDIIGGDKIS